MRIVIDMQGAQTESRYRGIGRHTFAFAKAVARNRGKHEIILVLNNLFPKTIEPIRSEFQGLLPQENIRVWNTLYPVMERQEGNHYRRQIAELTRERFIASLQADVVHVCSLFEGFVDDAVTSINHFDCNAYVSVSLHDLIPLQESEFFLDPVPVYKQHYMRKLDCLKYASLCLAVSESSRLEAIELIGLSEEKLVNISSGIELFFYKIPTDIEAEDILRNKFNLKKTFVLHTGGSADIHKNLDRLVMAFSDLDINLRKNYQLVFAGRINEQQVTKLTDLANNLALNKDQLIFTGYVSDEELVLFYNLCTLFVFPSLREGFGLPALEAMSCGAPVIAANTTSLPEVVGLDEALFDPNNVAAITAKITQALTDNTFRKLLSKHGLQQAKKFSWDITAKRAIEAWQALTPKQEPKYSHYTYKEPRFYQALKPHLAKMSKGELVAIASSLAQNNLNGLERQLLVDVSDLSQGDGETGVQLVLSGYLKALLEFPPAGFRVEPVYASLDHGYLYARCFTHQFLSIDNDLVEEVDDEPVSWQRGDIFFGSDRQHHVQLSHKKFFQCLHSEGVIIKFLVHDYVPIQLGNSFDHSDIKEHYQQWLTMITGMDEIILISSIAASIQKELLAIYSKGANSKSLNKISWQQSAETLKTALVVNNYKRHQLLVDISELVQYDTKTGIQRVVRSNLKQWLECPPDDYKVEPVYATINQPYRYARQFTGRFLDRSDGYTLKDDVIDYANGDIFFVLDLQAQVQPAQQKFYQELRHHGVRVQFLVYDLLPIQMPQYFPVANYESFNLWLEVVCQNDGAVCVSQTTANDLSNWIEQNCLEPKDNFTISCNYSGADISSSDQSEGLPDYADSILKNIKSATSFLVVATIEPRKAHAQVLDAFELLWQSKQAVNLVLVGKQGWKVSKLIKRLKNHPEAGKRLFWLEWVSDEYLEKIYAASSCLIVASYGEGFGLPLIEAAQHDLPIIARDIAIFREVAGKHAFYFDAKQPEELAQALQDWLSLHRKNMHPQSTGMPWLTWQESARKLLELILIKG